jgi:hypothetical protein
MIDREYVEWYCRAIERATARDSELRGYTHNRGMVYPEYGRRFTRIVNEGENQRFVHAFVDMTNGDVIKAAGWKAPQRGKNGLAVRFNLVDDESRECGFRAIDPYGSYLYEGAIRFDKTASTVV